MIADELYGMTVRIHFFRLLLEGSSIIRVTCVGSFLFQGPWMTRQALHAAALLLKHPETHQPLLITAPLPEDMHRVLERLGLPCPDPRQLLTMLEGTMVEQ